MDRARDGRCFRARALSLLRLHPLCSPEPCFSFSLDVPTAATAYAPGRANLFGEHAECTAAFLLPVCLELGTAVVGAKRSVGPAEVQLFSAAAQQVVNWDGKATKIDAEDQGTWRGLVKGCVLTFGEGYQEKEGRAFECPAFSAVITSNVPQRSGLASSASLTVAFMTFLEELSGCRFKPEKKAQLCLAATREVAGAQCGIIDHFAAAMGKHGNAILVDYRTLSSVCYPTGNGAVKILVTKTGANPTLGAAGYAQRLTCCAEALQAVNASAQSAVKTLSNAELSAVEALEGSISEGAIRCARHVITENQRCQGAAAAFKSKVRCTPTVKNSRCETDSSQFSASGLRCGRQTDAQQP